MVSQRGECSFTAHGQPEPRMFLHSSIVFQRTGKVRKKQDTGDDSPLSSLDKSDLEMKKGERLTICLKTEELLR